ncbi:MAG TPA: rod shape-determining protein MreC [Vicinamibacterales bacterium]|nr:rod shape-determining protein MreC [Vicinamibacterales bacterium]
MASVQLSQRPLLVFAGAVVLHVILISAQVSTTAGIPFIQVVTFGVFSEVQRGTMTSVDSVRGVWTGYVALRDVQEENEALKRELQTLQVRLQEERAQAQRAENFRQLLELRERAGVDTLAAEIIAGPADLEFRDMTIDKGSVDGIARDMAVVSPAGVVGRVTLTSPRAARVQMLIDRNAAAGAMIERTRAQGLVRGKGTTLSMDYVPGTADVRQGDLVVTSGIDKIYPKGFVIGTVEAIERGRGTFHEIVVQPSVDFSRLEEVLVVTTPPPAITAEQIAREAEAIAAEQRQPQKNQSPAPQTPPSDAAPPARAPANTTPRRVSPGEPGA